MVCLFFSFFTLIAWLPGNQHSMWLAFPLVGPRCSGRREGHLQDSFPGAPRKSGLGILPEFHAVPASEECLLPRGLWVPEPAEGRQALLPSPGPRGSSSSRGACAIASAASGACSALPSRAAQLVEREAVWELPRCGFLPPRGPQGFLLPAPGPESTARNPLFSQEGSGVRSRAT